jgi:hypothetical protein
MSHIDGHVKRSTGNGRTDSISSNAERPPTSAFSTSTNDWITGTLTAMLEATEWMQPSMRQDAHVSTAVPETVLKGMSDFGHAGDPLGFMAAYIDLSNRQLEDWAKPMTAAMQQLIDMQLAWFGNFEKMRSQSFDQVRAGSESEDDGRTAWLNAQDNWLAMTQSWIDSAAANLKTQ